MKPWMETVIVTLKGLCYIVVGVGATLGTSLSQWSNSGEWPDRINWVVIIGACSTAGANSLLSFLSGSYVNYKAKMNGNGNGAPLPPVTTAPPTKP